MSKWKCHKINCVCGCEVNLDSQYAPVQCLCFVNRTPKWELVQNEPEKRSIADFMQKKHNLPCYNFLPAWCKVGEWVWANNSYHKITRIEIYGCSAPIISLDDGNKYTFGALSWYDVYQARLRPYNESEMRSLLGKVIEHDNLFLLVTYYDGRDNKITLNGYVADAKRLLNEGFTIDGKPCGVLEHFDPEREEWVE